MATALLTRCPHCGARFKLKDESAAGKKIKCRECETPFIVKLARADGSGSANGRRAGNGKAKSRPKPQDPDAASDDGFDDFDDFGEDFGSGAAPPPRLPPRRSTKKKPKRKSAAAAAVAPAEDASAVRQKPPADVGKMIRLGGGGVMGVGVLAAMWFVFLKPAEPIAPPAAYGSFEHPKQAFKCEYPESWEQEAGGDTVRWAKWTKGAAKIHIRQGAAGGALSDIVRAGSDPNEEDESLRPEAVLHEDGMIKNPVVEEYSDYQEHSTFTVQSKTGGIRISEFTGSGYRGFRATAIGGQGVLRIVCHCRESDWDVCKPIFERVIQSIGR